MIRMTPSRNVRQMRARARRALACALAVVLAAALVPDARALAAGTYDTFAPGEVPDYILRYDESLGAYVIDIDAWNRLTPEQKALFDVDFVIENNQTTGETRVVENGQEGYHFGAEDGPEYVPEEAPSDPEAARPILDEPAEKGDATSAPADSGAQPASVDLASKLGVASAQGGAPDENGELADGSEGDGPALAGAAAEGPDELSEQEEGDFVGLAAALAQGEFGSGLLPQAAEGSDVTNFGYTGAMQPFVADASADWSGDAQTGAEHDVGYWKLQVYGAQGGSGNSNATKGGYGGYAEGVVRLEDGMGLSVYVGSQGNAPAAGWNGGGQGYYGTKVKYNQYGCGGGGATDVRIGGETLYNRLIVAGGGGGSFRGYAGYWSGYHRRTEGRGGDGGGESGGQGRAVAWANPGGGGGTQYAGGAGGQGSKKYGYAGTFGQGAAAPTSVGKPGAGGGGGWWGGGSGGGGTKNAGKYKATAGGGGSGFTYVGQDMSELIPASGAYLVDPSYALIGASMKVGQRSGSGYATITHLAWNTTFDANDSQGTTRATGEGKSRDKTYVTSNDGTTYYAAYTIPGDTPETCGYSRPGYTFAGWNTAPDGSGESYTGEPMLISSDIVLYAQWEPNIYEVALDNADATQLGTSVVFEKFDTGLFADASCEHALAPESFSKPVRAYNVSFEPTGGRTPSTSLTAEYTFEGYYTEAGGAGTEMIDAAGAPTGDFGVTTIYDEGATLHADWTSGSVTLPAPTRDGYSFEGWYASSDGGATLGERIGGAGEPYTPSSDVTLYARWVPLIYRVDLDNAGAYDSQSGTISGYDAAHAAGMGTGSVFEQYATNILDADGRDASGAPLGSPIDSVTAPKQIYQVRYEHMTGTDTPSPALPSAQTSSYAFKGYFTAESGGTRLIDGCEGGGRAALTDALKAGDLFLSDTTLHAQWNQSSVTLPEMAHWEGHRFAGWGTQPSGSLTFLREGQSYTPVFDESRGTGDATLYAYWKINTYAIDYFGVEEAVGFNPPGAVATGEEDTGVKYNVTFTVPNPVRPGYEFIGWRIEDMDDIEHTIQGEKTHDTTFEVTKANGRLSPAGTSLCNLREDDGVLKMTALWQPKVYPVTLDDTGGAGGSGTVFEEYATNVWKTRSGSEGAYTYADPLHHATETAEKGTVSVPAKARSVAWRLDSVLDGETLAPDTSHATMDGSALRQTDTADYRFLGYFDRAQAGIMLVDDRGQVAQDAFATTLFEGDGEHRIFAQWENPGVKLPFIDGVPYLRNIGWNTAPDGSGDSLLPGDTFYPEAVEPTPLYAQWDKPTYPVTYDANGGVGAPAPGVKSHNVDLAVTTDAPTWGLEYYPGPILDFDVNCTPGEGQSASTGVAGDHMATVITRTHDFVSWNTERKGGGTTFAPGAAYAANAAATLCAQWKVTDTVGAVQLPQATRTGYTFDGWYTSSDGGATLGTRVGDEAGRYAPLANETLYAKWVPNAYKVAFHDGDATLGERSLTYDSAAPLLTGVRQGPGTISANELTATREGWTFAGWESRPGSFEVVYQAAEEVVNLTDAPAGTVDLYALWQRDVTFVGGVVGELSPTSESAAAPASDAGRIRTQADQAAADAVTLRQLGDASGSTSVTAPQIAPIGGWDAAGWLPSTSATSASVALAGETFVPTDVATFYAGHARQVELAYDGNGASFGETAPSLDTQRYNVSGDITTPALVLAPNGFTRDDFFFDKWSMGNPAETVHDWTPQVEDAPRATALAEWASLDDVVPAGYYTINYDPNGGTGHMDSRTVEYADAINLDAPAFTLEGATFKGWNTAPDGTGEFFDDGELVAMLAKPNESITLYARWNMPARAIPTDEADQDGSDTPKTSDPTTLAAPLALVLAGAALAVIGARRRRRE